MIIQYSFCDILQSKDFILHSRMKSTSDQSTKGKQTYLLARSTRWTNHPGRQVAAPRLLEFQRFKRFQLELLPSSLLSVFRCLGTLTLVTVSDNNSGSLAGLKS